jgi:hypothetical protein
MVTCNRCGAELPLDAWECPYCRTVTAHGFARREAEAAAFRAQAEADRARDHAFASAQRAEAERSLQRSSRHALLWSLGGFLLCCSPLALIGLVLGFRSRALARRVGLVIPVTATLGIVVAVIQMLVFAAAIAFGIHAQMQVDARLEALERELGTRPDQPVLTQPTACALAERFLLQHGYGKHSETAIEHLRCDGALEQTAQSAELGALEFDAGDQKVRAHACFSRGARWSVTAIQEPKCSQPAAPPAGSSSVR